MWKGLYDRPETAPAPATSPQVAAPEPAPGSPSPPRPAIKSAATAFGSSSARPNIGMLISVPPNELFGVPYV